MGATLQTRRKSGNYQGGCGLTAFTAAFFAAAGDRFLQATASAFAFYGLCADKAEKISDKPGGFSVAFLDTLYSIENEDISTLIKVRDS